MYKSEVQKHGGSSSEKSGINNVNNSIQRDNEEDSFRSNRKLSDEDVNILNYEPVENLEEDEATLLRTIR